MHPLQKKMLVTKAELPDVAKQFADFLSKNGKFVLWLCGELGAGKTTFAGYLLHALGLPETVPVLSPTFTVMTEYETSIGLIGHLDLYRLVDGDEDSLESLLSSREFAGLIIEWPERGASSPLIQKTHRLDIRFVENLDQRELELS